MPESNNKKNNRKSKVVRSRGTKKHRSTPAYRKLVIRYKVISAVFIVAMLLLGIPNIFTHKQEYRSQGIELYTQGNFEEAVSELQKALDEKQWFSENVDVDVMLYQASAYIHMDDYTSAKAVYEKLLSDYPDRYYDRDEISYLSGLCDTLTAYKAGKYSDSLDALKEACDRGYTELSLYTAVCCESIQKYDDMKYYLDLYTQTNQADAYVYSRYADMYIATGDYDSAVTSVESALALNDSEYMQELYYRQIQCYEVLGDYTKAYELSENYVSMYPSDEKGIKLNEFLVTRAYPDTEVINDIFGVNPDAENVSSQDEEDKVSVKILSDE
jgi:tetratricopeptide (TPR) repeat protein